MPHRPHTRAKNSDGRPFHGEQYIGLTLTTKSWMAGLVEIPEESWIRGGTPETSRIVPWGVQSLDGTIVDEAVVALVDELHSQ